MHFIRAFERPIKAAMVGIYVTVVLMIADYLTS